MLTIGTQVVFGRPKGQKRDGVITKINQKSYIIKTDDNPRGYRVSKSLVKKKTQQQQPQTTNYIKMRFTGHNLENEYVANLHQDAQKLSKDEMIQSLITLQLMMDGMGKKIDELEQENKKLKEE